MKEHLFLLFGWDEDRSLEPPKAIWPQGLNLTAPHGQSWEPTLADFGGCLVGWRSAWLCLDLLGRLCWGLGLSFLKGWARTVSDLWLPASAHKGTICVLSPLSLLELLAFMVRQLPLMKGSPSYSAASLGRFDLVKTLSLILFGSYWLLSYLWGRARLKERVLRMLGSW
jgi:hypothetical protein